MHCALATCADLPDWEVDDAPFHRALAASGATLARPVWSDPGVDWGVFDAVLIRTTWDYQEKRGAFVRWAERVASRTLLLNPPAVVRWNTHKRYLRELEQGQPDLVGARPGAGVRIAPTVWLGRGERPDLAAIMAERGWRRGFLKPCVGATARETLRFADDQEGLARAQAHIERLLPQEDLMLQPYLASVETAGERSLLYFDGQFSHAVDKIPVPGDYRVQDDWGASDRPAQPREDERALARAALALLPADLLYARVDLLRDDDGHPCLNELEVVEPSLFFRHDPASPARLAAALRHRVEGRR